ncbi:MAG TPA: beta-L-arabinofuranosidase domain-containing protein, partial [Kofleriaceae bacterium]|nr:beta-L-arabinofuranosidase domain-containing protein [Kofleriaceae bacterium]
RRGRRALALLAVWTLPSLCFLALTAGFYRHWRIEVPARLPPSATAAIMTTLRTALDGGAVREPDDPALGRPLPHGGPVAVTVYLASGKAAARVDGHGATIALATRDAAQQLAQHAAGLPADERDRARIVVDVVVGRGPLERDDPLLKLAALQPGVDGLEATATMHDGREATYLLAPCELVAGGLLGKTQVSKAMPEVGTGVDFDRADRLIAERAQLLPRAWTELPRRYRRVRTDAFVEPPGHQGAPLPLYRCLPPGPDVTPDNLERQALEGARYLVAHLGPNGRYVYEQNLTTGQGTDPLRGGAYSLPRHAGTTYFLAEAYRITRAAWLREPIERAFAHLDTLIEASTCKGLLRDGTRFACIADRGERRPGLGNTALAVVALVEYQRATGDTRYLDLATRLGAFILMMQRPDGSFRHIYDLDQQRPSEKEHLLYFSGEAALAMARMYTITGDDRYARSAERALDSLVGAYDSLVGGFVYGEEHWTCITAEALWPRVAKQKYLDFCLGLTRFWGEAQPGPGDYPDDQDLLGAQMVTPFLMPQNTPAGSHSEASISTYLLARHMGHLEPALRTQILATLHYLLRQQIRPDSDFTMSSAAHADGGMPGNPVDRTVRIDYVQHTCSAMLRGVELAREVPRSPAYP